MRSDRLERLSDRVVSCHVVVEMSGHRHRHGNRFHASINLGLPGHEILVGHQPPDDKSPDTALAAVDHAFGDAERELEDWVRQKRVQRRHAETRKSL